jgi:hypothetical protein
LRLAFSIMPKQPMSVAEAGRKGGIARAKKLSAERMREIALQGYKASSLSRKRKACQAPQTDENKK